jgi:transcriptional regulator with XRE-family HTH domain
MRDLPSLGAEIARRRSALRLTQTELAARARIGRSTLDAFENGRLAELGFAKIARTLAALGLGLKLVEARSARPTLEDLRDDDDDQGLDERR